MTKTSKTKPAYDKRAVEATLAAEPLTMDAPKDTALVTSRDKGVALAKSINDAVADIEATDSLDRDPVMIRSLRDELRSALSRVERYVVA